MDYDVVIVGGGPSGSTAAITLAEHNKHVLVVEKHRFPREKPCGGGLSTRVWKEMPFVEPFLDSICYGAITHSTSLKYSLTINRKKPLLGMVRRATFDKKLLDYAKQQGADVHQGKELTDIDKTTNGFELHLGDKDSVSSKLILGCDGMRSTVADKLELNKKHRSFGLCVYKEHKIPAATINKLFTSDHLAQIFIKTQDVSGYGWVFPKKQYLNIGLGEFYPSSLQKKPKNQLNQRFIDYVSMLQKKNILPESFTADDAKGATLPLNPVKQSYDEGVLLCGDAAGLINPISGEGIYYAMTSGRLAAETMVEAIDHHQRSSKFMSRYQQQWMHKFGRDILKLGRYNKSWDHPSENFMKYVSGDPTFAKLLIGVVGGQLSFSRYKLLLGLRYGYVKVKDKIIPIKK